MKSWFLFPFVSLSSSTLASQQQIGCWGISSHLTPTQRTMKCQSISEVEFLSSCWILSILSWTHSSVASKCDFDFRNNKSAKIYVLTLFAVWTFYTDYVNYKAVCYCHWCYVILMLVLYIFFCMHIALTPWIQCFLKMHLLFVII